MTVGNSYETVNGVPSKLMSEMEMIKPLIICFMTMSTGKTGDWKNHFSPDLNKRVDDWIERNLAGSDLKFFFELENQD